MTMAHVMRTAHCRYHETTESLNFFIDRMAIVPPADKNGINKRKMYRT